MKGNLDAKELESWKKDELVALANKLGVNAEGTKAEIAARCAAEEVEIPDEETADEVTVEATQRYKDLQLERIVEAGETLEVSKERAAELIAHNVAKTI